MNTPQTPPIHSAGDAAILATAQQYLVTPRALDDRLRRVVTELEASAVGLLTIGTAAAAVLVVVGLSIAAFARAVAWIVPGIAVGVAALAVVITMLIDRSSMRTAKAQCLASLRDGPLVVAHVVQANRSLYEPGNNLAPALFVFSRTPGRALDLRYGRWLAARIHALKGAPNPGGDAHQAWMAVNDDFSSPTLHLSPAFASDADAHLYAGVIEQTLLPARCIGEELAFVAIHCVSRGVFMVF